MTALTTDVLHFHHTPFYCEENVYLLCKKLCNDGKANAEGSDLFVAFISNEKKQIPLWNQKASKRADGIILWDYHVICIQIKQGALPPLVWDLDSTLPFPSPLPFYVSETIRPSFQLFSNYNRLYRIVHAPVFLRCFASDRRHMKDSGGNWIEEPPTHEPIVAEESKKEFHSNFMKFVVESGQENIELIDENLERHIRASIADLIDGTVHNLNEYMNISVSDAIADAAISSVKDVIFTQKHGVVIKENQLEELISQLSSSQ